MSEDSTHVINGEIVSESSTAIVPTSSLPENTGKRKNLFTGKDEVSKRGYFTGADDPRRHKTGQVNKAAVSFRKELRTMLVEEGLVETSPINGTTKPRIARVIERIYTEAEAGQPWACQLIFDRVDGKVSQPISGLEDAVVLVIRGASTDDL